MSELRTKLVDIQTEKNTKLTPENLREGITCLGVTGILKEKIDTSDATATAADIIKNKTAYVNDELVTGTMHEVTANTTHAPFGDAITLFNNPDMETFAMMSETTFDTALRVGSDISMTVPYTDIAECLGLTSEQIIKGNTILGIEGTGQTGVDTSDATATSMDLPRGITAYARGEKITGVLSKYENTNLIQAYGGYTNQGSAVEIKSIPHEGNPSLHGEGVVVSIWVPTEENGLVAENIVEGVNIFGVEGTASTGTDTSDATATSNDIIVGKTAYVNGEKLEGSIAEIIGGTGFAYTRLIDVVNNKDLFVTATHKGSATYALRPNAEVQVMVPYSEVTNAIGLTADKIAAGNTILGVEGTAPVTFATVEEMNSNTVYPENTFAIVYGTEYIGTYKLDNGAWTQIGDATDGAEMMKILNETDGDILEYEGNGGTDEEINAVLEDILTNPNISENDSDIN